MTVSINGTSGLTFNDASTQNTAATGFGFKNRIINGQMVLDQRNAGAAVTGISSGGTYIVDRWKVPMNSAGTVSAQQNAGSVTPPSGFTNYLGITVTSSATVGAGGFGFVAQSLEGFNIADLGWGTASASTVTLSFWVRSSLTGTFGGALRNSAGNRSYPFTYTISAANTWEQKSITIVGDTTGTWLATNGTGIDLSFGLGVGSTYSGTAGSWSANNFISATGATSVVGTSGATFYITGVQLEKGSTATSFDYRPYGTELALCQRYYEKSYDIGTVAGTNTNIGRFQSTATSNGGGDMVLNIRFCVVKRAAPTMTAYAPDGTINVWNRQSSAGTANATLNWEFQSTGGTGAYIAVGANNATCSGNGHWTASAEL